MIETVAHDKGCQVEKGVPEIIKDKSITKSGAKKLTEVACKITKEFGDKRIPVGLARLLY